METGPHHSLKQRLVELVNVRSLPGSPTRGRVSAAGMAFPCALGRSGVAIVKREGDGVTPCGRYRALAAFWRQDRLARPRTLLPLSPIRPADGWCDDSGDRNYNRPIELPYGASAETMRREDELYDIVVDLDWNRGPIAKGRGSAIFMHVAREDYAPTEGCIALARRDLTKLLERIGPQTVFDVRA